jgi:hypothetical protein
MKNDFNICAASVLTSAPPRFSVEQKPSRINPIPCYHDSNSLLEPELNAKIPCSFE